LRPEPRCDFCMPKSLNTEIIEISDLLGLA